MLYTMITLAALLVAHAHAHTVCGTYEMEWRGELPDSLNSFRFELKEDDPDFPLPRKENGDLDVSSCQSHDWCKDKDVLLLPAGDYEITEIIKAQMGTNSCGKSYTMVDDKDNHLAVFAEHISSWHSHCEYYTASFGGGTSTRSIFSKVFTPGEAVFALSEPTYVRPKAENNYTVYPYTYIHFKLKGCFASPVPQHVAVKCSPFENDGNGVYTCTDGNGISYRWISGCE